MPREPRALVLLRRRRRPHVDGGGRRRPHQRHAVRRGGGDGRRHRRDRVPLLPRDARRRREGRRARRSASPTSPPCSPNRRWGIRPPRGAEWQSATRRTSCQSASRRVELMANAKSHIGHRDRSCAESEHEATVHARHDQKYCPANRRQRDRDLPPSTEVRPNGRRVAPARALDDETRRHIAAIAPARRTRPRPDPSTRALGSKRQRIGRHHRPKMRPTGSASESRERLEAGELLPDHQGVDLLGPLVGDHGLEVRHVAHDRVLERDAVGAEDPA